MRSLVFLLLSTASVLAQGPGPVPPGNPQPTTGFNSGPVTLSKNPANATHLQGTSVGGLYTLPVARVAGASGEIRNLLVHSLGGYTNAYEIRAWSKNPTSTTCADNVAFTGNVTDNQYLIESPFTVYPYVPVGSTGSYRSVNVNWNYKNTDSPTTTNIYLCIIAGADDAKDANNAVVVTVSGPQN